jgi:hypothetical protein
MAALVPNLPKVEQHIVEMTNQIRRNQSLPALKLDAMLANAARAYANALARSGKFAHDADGRTPGQRAESAGYKACDIAENLAMDKNTRGFDTGELALQAMAGWMNSPPHRKNILSPSATEIGVGVAALLHQGKFISVELLARPQSASYRFEIVNASTVNVSFTLLGKTHELKPGTTLQFTTCASADLVFSKPGGFFSSASEIARLHPENHSIYKVKSGASGGLVVEVARKE